MATVIKQRDPTLTALAFTRALATSQNIQAQKLENKKRKQEMQHIGERLQTEDSILKSRAQLTQSNANIAGLEEKFKKETLGARVAGENIDISKEIGEALGGGGQIPTFEDLVRITDNMKVDEAAKPGMLAAMQGGAKSEIMGVQAEMLDTLKSEAQIAGMLAESPVGLELVKQEFPNSRISQLAEGRAAQLKAQPSKNQAQFDKAQIKAASDALALVNETGKTEEQDIATINDPKADKALKASAATRQQRRDAAKSVLEPLGVKTRQVKDVQDTAGPPKITGASARVSAQNALARIPIPPVSKVSELPETFIAGMHAELLAKGVEMTPEEFDKEVQKAIDKDRAKDAKKIKRGSQGITALGVLSKLVR